MSSIRQKISRPYVGLIILMQIIILVIFNVTVTFYSYEQAKEELLKTVNRIEFNLNDYPELGNRGFEGRPHMANFMVTGENITAIMVEDGNYQRPPSGQGNLTDAAITEAINLLKDVEVGEIISYYIDGQYYNAIEVEVANLPNTEQMIYVSVGYFVDGFVDTINLILISISLVSVIIFIFVSDKLAKGIANPIGRITKTIKQLKTHEVTSLDEDNSSDELYELTREINIMSDRIYNYDRAQKTFLHNASHELRTPLMSIQGYAEGLREGVFTESAATKVIINETQRLTDIVEELMTLVRLENYDTESTLQYCNLTEFLSEIIESMQGVASKTGKMISANFLQETIYATYSPELLRQTIVNLISNGLRHAETTVTIHLAHQESILIYVEDDGNGVSPDDEEHIFERFYKGKGGNYGLGLSIVKTAIEQMNGQIRLMNSDKGAVFEIRLKD